MNKFSQYFQKFDNCPFGQVQFTPDVLLIGEGREGISLV
jgi:hypothetical protein